jgi:TM2 domain-containing membrane protein YozV
VSFSIGVLKHTLRSRLKQLCFCFVFQFMPGQGSTSNVIAAVCSFFIPGLGQLVQGRILMALIQFVLAGVLWLVWLGWLIHLWSIIDAALWKGPRR